MSLIRRAGGRILKIIQRITGVDPAGIVGQVQVYAKDVAGTAQLFAVDGDGTAHQLTPAGGGGGSNVFVFQPGGTPGGNVYDDWQTLVDACNAIQGRRFIEFDNQFNTITIPDGTYDMYDVVWIGTPIGFMASNTVVDVQLDSGVELPGLREISRLRITAGGGVAAITDLDDGDILILSDFTQLLDGDNGPVVDLSSLFFKEVTIELRNGARVVDDAEEAIVGLDSGTLRLLMDRTSGMDSDSIAGTGGTLIIDTQSTDYSVSHFDFGGAIQVVDRTQPHRVLPQIFSGSFNAQPGSVHLVDVSAGAVDVNLPPSAAVSIGCEITIKNFSNQPGIINVYGNGSDGVDGAQYKSVTLGFGHMVVVNHGSGWSIISESVNQPERLAWEIHQNWLPPNLAAWTNSVAGGGTNTVVVDGDPGLIAGGALLVGPTLRQSVVANNDRATRYLGGIFQGPWPKSFNYHELTFALQCDDLAGTPGLVYQAGFIHDETAEPSGEDYIKLYKSSASANWFFRSQGTTSSDVDTGVPAGGLQRFRIAVRGATFVHPNVAELYIDDVLVATINADFPADDQFGVVFYLKSTGAANSDVYVGPVWLRSWRAPAT
jgi:hypothetical protein